MKGGTDIHQNYFSKSHSLTVGYNVLENRSVRFYGYSVKFYIQSLHLFVKPKKNLS